MRAEPHTSAPADTGADTIVIGLFEGEAIAHDVDGGLLQALVDSGEAKPGLRKLAVTHAGGSATSWSGSASATTSTPSAPASPPPRRRPRARARRALAVLGAAPPRRRRRRRRVRRGHAARRLPLPRLQERARARTRLERARGLRPPRRRRGGGARRARGRGGQRRARDLQNAPANDMTPEALAERARAAAELGADRRDDGPRRDRGRRHGRVRRRRARQRPGAAADHDPLRRRGATAGARPRRQGRHVRLRRHLDQARPEDERDEVRHVGRRGRCSRRRARSPSSGCRCGS